MTLEQFRKAAIEEIKNNKELIKRIISKNLSGKFKIYIHGSVLSKSKFHENSDIDLAVVINNSNLESGPNELLTDILRNEFISRPFDFGVLDVIVFNKEIPKKVEELWSNAPIQ